MTIAGGISAALFARERTGETSVIDVSLMSVGAWAMALSISIAMLSGVAMGPMPLNVPMALPWNPTLGDFRTSDGRWITFNMLQPGRYFADVCKHLDIEHLLDDERFATAEGLMANGSEVGQHIADAIAKQPYAYWVEHLKTMEGQWAPVQDPIEIASDPQVEANGYLVTVTDAEGNERQLVANPVQFDETPPVIARGPQFAEHTDDILRELGKSEDEIIQLKIDGACT